MGDEAACSLVLLSLELWRLGAEQQGRPFRGAWVFEPQGEQPCLHEASSAGPLAWTVSHLPDCGQELGLQASPSQGPRRPILLLHTVMGTRRGGARGRCLPCSQRKHWCAPLCLTHLSSRNPVATVNNLLAPIVSIVPENEASVVAGKSDLFLILLVSDCAVRWLPAGVCRC